MKIRAGFVSNSSSSSFILTKNVRFATIWDVALAMILCRDSGDGTWLLDNFRDVQEIMKRKSQNDQCTRLTFRTVNFDTFILDTGTHYWIATSNNHYGFQLMFAGYQDYKLKQSDYKGLPVGDYVELYMEKDYEWEEL